MQVTINWEKNYYGAKSGDLLPHEKVLAGRQKELDNIWKFKVKRDMTMRRAKELGLKFVRSIWLDDRKGNADDPEAVRSRLVATDVNTCVREDCAQSTPAIKAFRMIISVAATKADASGNRVRVLALYDISVAFFHADSDGTIAVIPPRGMR